MTLKPPFSTRGRDILDGTGQPVKLVGVNWGGAHQNGLVPAGLDKLHRSKIIQRIVDWKLNCVRSRSRWAPSSPPTARSGAMSPIRRG